MFFSWFTNMAMHVGMGDLSVFRYARKARYGLATATGMYLGHFLAWIAASMLYALQLHRDPSNTDVLPGPLAAGACGIVGLLCVIIASWTTANPTIYRAGLAFQAIVPTASRFRVTFLTGLACAIAGMFPAIAMQLLGFVAPVRSGADADGRRHLLRLLADAARGHHAVLRRGAGRGVNWAPAIAWLVTLAVCLAAVWQGYIEIYFAGLPGWFIAAVLYLAVSRLVQRGHVRKVLTT